MLDIRPVAYIAPVSEVDFASVALTVRLVNYADETGLVTGLFRIYNDSTGLLIHSSDTVPVSLAAGQSVDVTALTDFDPPAPADDTYFVMFDGQATNALVPDGIPLHLGSFYFDVKPVGMGPAPAAHHATHEDGGSDEIDVTGLAGLTGPHDFLDLAENAAPGIPAADTARIYAEDKGGHTVLSFRDATGMDRQLVRDSVFIGYNDTGVLIPKLSIVYDVGNVGGLPSIALAKADAAATMPAIGVACEAIADGTSGRIMQVGLLENIDTSALAPGTQLWVSSTVAGGTQTTPPVWPALRQQIGVILVQDAVVGAAQVIARSAFDDAVINHAALMNLDYASAAHTGFSPNPHYHDNHIGIFYENDMFSGLFPWFDFTIASGTYTWIAATTNHPGSIRLSSSTSANSGKVLYLSNPTVVILISGLETTELILRPQTLAGTTIRAGFINTLSSADASNGAYVEMAQVGGVDGVIVGKTATNSTRSTTGTSYTLVTDTWYRLRIVVNSDATRVDFYLYSEAGALLWTDNLTTNIPTAAGRETGHGIVATNSGTTAMALVDVDYLNLAIDRVLTR